MQQRRHYVSQQHQKAWNDCIEVSCAAATHVWLTDLTQAVPCIPRYITSVLKFIQSLDCKGHVLSLPVDKLNRVLCSFLRDSNLVVLGSSQPCDVFFKYFLV